MASPQPHMDVLAGGPQDGHITQRPTTAAARTFMNDAGQPQLP